MDGGVFDSRVPRPVAEVPPARLADGTVVAKAWLLAQVAASPLEAVAGLATEEFAHHAPELCAAVLRAIGSEAELRRLGPEGDLAGLASCAGRVVGAGEPAAAAAAAGRLRSALWEALLPHCDPAALAPRLAHVCDVVIQATLTARHGSEDPLGDEALPVPANGVRALRAVEAEPADDEIVELRAARRAAQPWIEAVEHRIQSQERGSPPFTLLVLEADDTERLLSIDHDGEAARALALAEAAVRDTVRGNDVVVREHPGRLWIIADAVGVADARLVGERMADAVTGAGLLHGAPLTVSIGFAAYPQDGEDAEALAAHADEGVFAARAAGVRLA